VTSASGRELVVTGGDDGVARVWDPSIEGLKEPVAEFDDGLGGVVTAVEWSADGNQCFVGGIDNEIKVRRKVFAWSPKLARLTRRSTGLGSEKKGDRLHPQGSYRHRK
jgi:WD40 repeat protein